MSKKRSNTGSTSGSPPKKKVKLSSEAKEKEEKPMLGGEWTRTDPVTGKQGRLFKKDVEYALKQNRRRAAYIKMKKGKKKDTKSPAPEAQKQKKEEKTSDSDDVKLEKQETVIDLEGTDPSLLPLHKFTKRFKDHVCIVTGGGRGIGQAVATRLAQEGGIIYVLDKVRWRDTEKLILEDVGPNARVFGKRCDVTDESKVKSTIEEIIAENGYIDVLVNAVSAVDETKFTHKLTREEIERSLETNLWSMLHITQKVLPYMLNEEYGRIVSIASTEGLHGKKGHLPYSMAKAAVIAATKTMGTEFGKTGVMINCVAPAYVDYQVEKSGKQEQKAANKTPIGRAALLEEVSGLVAFVASEENTYTTGFCYELTGGI